MLEILVPGVELYDDVNERFLDSKPQVLHLEHSLISVSKWESKWNVPFISDKPRTEEQVIDYIRCMTLTQNVPPDVYYRLTQENINDVATYINLSMTATTFSNKEKPGQKRPVITSEVIYSWMFALQIPMECQKWHLNRLLTLINVCRIGQEPKKKMSKAEILRQNRELNAARLKQGNTRG